MVVKKQKASSAVFNIMKELTLEYYKEPKNISKSEFIEEQCTNDDLEELGLADDEANKLDAEVEVSEGVICID